MTERLAELQNTSPNITSEDLPKLIKVFHPDAEHDASPTKKAADGWHAGHQPDQGGPGAGEEEEAMSLARQRAARPKAATRKA